MRAAAVTGLWEQICVTPAQHTWLFFAHLRRAGLASLEHDVLTLAQAVAYSAMLALFPALVVSAAIVGLLPIALPLRSQLAVFFVRVLPANVVPLLQGYFSTGHRTQTAGALLGSVLVSLLGASNVLTTLMEGFRRAHDLPLPKDSLLRRRGRALAMVPVSLVPLAAVSALVVFGNLLTRWLAGELPGSLRSSFLWLTLLLRWTVALAGSTAILGLVYHLGIRGGLNMRERLEPWIRDPLHRPLELLRHRWGWRQSLPGAALATALWFIATLGFGVYVTRFANYSRVYGSLGAGIALMVWLYIIALCVLFGEEYNAQRRTGPALSGTTVPTGAPTVPWDEEPVTGSRG